MKKIALIAVLVLFLVSSVSAADFEFCIPIPEQHVTTVRDTLSIIWDYQGSKQCDPNGICETQKAFIERMERRRIKDLINAFLKETAANVAENAATQLDF